MPLRLYDDPVAMVLNEVGMDDTLFDETCKGDWSLGLTPDEIRELFREKSAPDPSKWTEPEEKDVYVSVDQAREDCTEQAEKEFEFLKKKLIDLKIVPEDFDPSAYRQKPLYDALVDWIFGPNSLVFSAFHAHVPAVRAREFPFFAHCVGTFLITCRYHVPLGQLYDEEKSEDPVRLQSTGLASLPEYKIFWDGVQGSCMPDVSSSGDRERTPGFLPFWRHLQDSINTFLRTLTIVGNDLYKSFVIDDDKVHRAGSKSSPHDGLKEQQHTKANRRGYVNHHLVQPCCQFISGLAFKGFGDTFAYQPPRPSSKVN